jgi:hypothetical protein
MPENKYKAAGEAGICHLLSVICHSEPRYSLFPCQSQKGPLAWASMRGFPLGAIKDFFTWPAR